MRARKASAPMRLPAHSRAPRLAPPCARSPSQPAPCEPEPDGRPRAPPRMRPWAPLRAQLPGGPAPARGARHGSPQASDDQSAPRGPSCSRKRFESSAHAARSSTTCVGESEFVGFGGPRRGTERNFGISIHNLWDSSIIYGTGPQTFPGFPVQRRVWRAAPDSASPWPPDSNLVPQTTTQIHRQSSESTSHTVSG